MHYVHMNLAGRYLQYRLFVDQYGDKIYARTLKELRAKCGGRVSKMYVEKKDGRSVHIGYVVGRRWLTEYAPVERPA